MEPNERIELSSRRYEGRRPARDIRHGAQVLAPVLGDLTVLGLALLDLRLPHRTVLRGDGGRTRESNSLSPWDMSPGLIDDQPPARLVLLERLPRIELGLNGVAIRRLPI